MRKIVGVYDSLTERYVKRELHNLSLLGFNTEAVENSTLEVKYNTPCFLAVKHNAVINNMTGKYSTIILGDWARSIFKSGI